MPHNAQASSSTDVSDHANGRDSPATISEPSTPRTSGEHEQEHKTPKFKFSPTMILENNGSVARDHLASERTFLAYVRTSLAISSAGVALVQLFLISTENSQAQAFARPLGATVVIIGLIVLLTGTQRYFLVQHILPTGYFPAARIPMLFISAVLAALVVIVFGVLIGVK